jgi:hypothetical protein
VQIASTSELDVAADRTQRGAAAERKRAVAFHGAIERLSQRGQTQQTQLAIDEPDIECGVVSNEKLVGSEEAPYVGGVYRKRLLEAQSRSREAMNLFGDPVVSRTRIEYQVKILQIGPTFD